MGISSKTVTEGDDLLRYIPQRGIIVMVDKYYGTEGDLSYSALEIKPDNIFVENGKFNESGVLEHIAQSCALRAGYFCEQQNSDVTIGYIGAVKKMKYFKLPSVGDVIFTKIRTEQEIFDVSLVTAETECNGELIATCEIKIFLDKKDKNRSD